MTAENTPDATTPDTIVLIHGLWMTPGRRAKRRLFHRAYDLRAGQKRHAGGEGGDLRSGALRHPL